MEKNKKKKNRFLFGNAFFFFFVSREASTFLKISIWELKGSEHWSARLCENRPGVAAWHSQAGSRRRIPEFWSIASFPMTEDMAAQSPAKTAWRIPFRCSEEEARLPSGSALFFREAIFVIIIIIIKFYFFFFFLNFYHPADQIKSLQFPGFLSIG